MDATNVTERDAARARVPDAAERLASAAAHEAHTKAWAANRVQILAKQLDPTVTDRLTALMHERRKKEDEIRDWYLVERAKLVDADGTAAALEAAAEELDKHRSVRTNDDDHIILCAVSGLPIWEDEQALLADGDVPVGVIPAAIGVTLPEEEDDEEEDDSTDLADPIQVQA
jgi:hypothetical protein